jgi:hypothetical protein
LYIQINYNLATVLFSNGDLRNHTSETKYGKLLRLDIPPTILACSHIYPGLKLYKKADLYKGFWMEADTSLSASAEKYKTTLVENILSFCLNN